ncbi:Triosephosphate isomerase [Pelomyxa schiedti]|nr:Triosephosphate isomerase [Pelomyxa schiedti]
MAATSSRKFFVGGNWKCNQTSADIKALVSALNASMPLPPQTEVVVAAPFVYLGLVRDTIDKYFAVAAQNCWSKKGAFTGEVAPQMLVDVGINWVILGHSERRHVIGETDAIIAEKTKAALACGLSLIPCVGETEQERVSGKTNDVINTQMTALAGAITDWSRVVIAYEPVWAIGTGRNATPAQAQEVHAYIRAWLTSHVSAEVSATCRILYGGSVTPANCMELATQPDIDGFLVGGASLDAAKLVPIIKSVSAKH